MDDSLQYRQLPDVGLADKIKEVFDQTKKDVAGKVSIDFIQYLSDHINNNKDNHPSFDTMSSQICLHALWHIFPELA